MRTIRDVLLEATAQLQAAHCDAPRLDAELLLMHVWQCSRVDLITRAHDAVPGLVLEQFQALLARRCLREPLAYIVGNKEFWSRDFYVNPDVLIPRPETEHLIEEVLRLFPDQQGEYTFMDMGTGSGCIAVTLACEYPKALVMAVDISEAALQVAASNAQAHGVSDRIQWICSDMFRDVDTSSLQLDALISNPPYVTLPEMDALEQELSFEPAHALTDGADGLTYLNMMRDVASQILKSGGYALFETGPCGLPTSSHDIVLLRTFQDLASHVRGGVYRKQV